MGYEKPHNFKEFWVLYVNEHKHPLNRQLHFIGTLGALFILGFSWFYSQPLYLFLAPVVGYTFAWIGHFVVEKNRPATFIYPFQSFISDFKMFGFMLVGRMGSEVVRARRVSKTNNRASS